VSLRIETNSPKLLEEILETIPTEPTPPFQSELTFIAHNISLSYEIDFTRTKEEIEKSVIEKLKTGRENITKDLKFRESYLQECEKHGVIPFSQMEYAFDQGIGIFLPKKYENKLDKSFPPDILIAGIALNSSLAGGKAYRIKVDPHYTNFIKFKEKFLPLLKRNNYFLNFGTITPNSGIEIRIGKECEEHTGVELELNSSGELAKQIKKWFSALKKKYDGGPTPRAKKPKQNYIAQEAHGRTPFGLSEEMLEEPKEATPSENLHCLLQAHYDALKLSVIDPICIATGSDDLRFSKQVYDISDTEDAEEIVKERVKKYKTTIQSFISQHQGMLKSMDDIEEVANIKNTSMVIKRGQEYLRKYEEHIEFINQFKKEKNRDDFLGYPASITQTRSNQQMPVLSVNPNQTYNGAIEAAQKLEETIKKLSPTDKIDFSAINTTETPYSGIELSDIAIKHGFDTSYRGRIEFTINMLEKQGFKL
jgi:hypothetical protein